MSVGDGDDDLLTIEEEKAEVSASNDDDAYDDDGNNTTMMTNASSPVCLSVCLPASWTGRPQGASTRLHSLQHRSSLTLRLALDR